tara:strand:+ start:663 stop:1496 length:834 start_codon:yes stop_codon:yes gene_type:complete
MFDKSKCIKSNNKNTCFDEKSLKFIADILHKTGNKINYDKPLYSQINKILKKTGGCKNEKCWLTMDSLIDNLSEKQLLHLKSNFKPPMPETWKNDHDKWLNTVDIESVLNRYMLQEPSFYSYGAVPIDSFDENICINDLCKFDLKKHISKGHSKIGLIYNTDKFGESGQHWISLYIDINKSNYKNPCIYFFDSYGTKPPKNVNEFAKYVIDQGSTNNINFKYTYNDKQHQTKGGECGVYCLHFLTYMKNGGNFDNYIKNKRDDEYMNKFRKYFYDPL